MAKVWLRELFDGDALPVDCPSTYEAAEALCGHRLDSRKTFCIIKGEVHQRYEFTRACPGMGQKKETFMYNKNELWGTSIISHVRQIAEERMKNTEASKSASRIILENQPTFLDGILDVISHEMLGKFFEDKVLGIFQNAIKEGTFWTNPIHDPICYTVPLGPMKRTSFIWNAPQVPELFYLYFSATLRSDLSVLTACVPLKAKKRHYREEGKIPVGFALYSPVSQHRDPPLPFIQKRGDDIARGRFLKGKTVMVNLLPGDRFPFRLTILTAFFAAQHIRSNFTPSWLWKWREHFVLKEAHFRKVSMAKSPVSGTVFQSNKQESIDVQGPIVLNRNPKRFYEFCEIPFVSQD